MRSIVTMDETAVSFSMPETKQQSMQYLPKGSPAPTKAKVAASRHTQMVISFFIWKGLITSITCWQRPLSMQCISAPSWTGLGQFWRRNSLKLRRMGGSSTWTLPLLTQQPPPKSAWPWRTSRLYPSLRTYPTWPLQTFSSFILAKGSLQANTLLAAVSRRTGTGSATASPRLTLPWPLRSDWSTETNALLQHLVWCTKPKLLVFFGLLCPTPRAWIFCWWLYDCKQNLMALSDKSCAILLSKNQSQWPHPRSTETTVLPKCQWRIQQHAEEPKNWLFPTWSPENVFEWSLAAATARRKRSKGELSQQRCATQLCKQQTILSSQLLWRRKPKAAPPGQIGFFFPFRFSEFSFPSPQIYFRLDQKLNISKFCRISSCPMPKGKDTVLKTTFFTPLSYPSVLLH